MEIKQRMRYDITAYRKAKAKLPLPDGKHCIICGKPLPKFKRKYCSSKCFNSWYQKFPRLDWNVIRRKAMRRDKYTCVKCKKKLKKKKKYWGGYKYKGVVDHIVPIALGGEEFDLKNLQTLCIECNKIKTKHDTERITELRRKISEEEEIKYRRRIHVPISDVI